MKHEVKAVAYMDMIADIVEQCEKECEKNYDGYENDSTRLDTYGEILSLIQDYKTD